MDCTILWDERRTSKDIIMGTNESCLAMGHASRAKLSCDDLRSEKRGLCHLPVFEKFDAHDT
jgi:hypothetical protein